MVYLIREGKGKGKEGKGTYVCMVYLEHFETSGSFGLAQPRF